MAYCVSEFASVKQLDPVCEKTEFIVILENVENFQHIFL